MEVETLNIDFHRKDLIIKALNKSSNCDEAAAKLGISVRTLYKYKRTYKVSHSKLLKKCF